MKERYVKPDLRVEYFTLSQSVANGGCGAPHWDDVMGGPNQVEKTTCGWDFGVGPAIWLLGIENCQEKWPDEAVSGICYNNPDGGFSIFGS